MLLVLTLLNFNNNPKNAKLPWFSLTYFLDVSIIFVINEKLKTEMTWSETQKTRQEILISTIIIHKRSVVKISISISSLWKQKYIKLILF